MGSGAREGRRSGDREADAVVETSLRRAVALMTASSALVPVIGVLSAPLLTHGLGVGGRGELSVSTAPNLLLASVATLGLPEALTFVVARNPRAMPRLLAWASAATLVLSALGLVLVILLGPFLSGGDRKLQSLILVGSVFAVPALLLALVRGAASGLQMWNAVALERVLTAVLRVLLLIAFVLAGQLTVLNAVLITTVGPLVGALAYLRLAHVSRTLAPSGETTGARGLPAMFHYALRTWFGAVAGILLSRLSQLLFAPISNVEELGLFVVAVTISDVPLITSLAIRDALFGFNSRRNDAQQLASTIRRTVLVGLIGGALLGASMPFWIAPVFGGGFDAAIVPTEIMLISSLANIPGFLVAGGIAAWGRPGVRSLGLVLTLVVNFVLFLLLVPPLGAVGAAAAAAASSIVSAAYMAIRGSRIIGISVRELLLPTASDLTALIGVGSSALRRVHPRRTA